MSTLHSPYPPTLPSFNLFGLQISCGDFHSAAITQSNRLYIWGGTGTAEGVGGASMSSRISTGGLSNLNNTGGKHEKNDVTSMLGGVPKKVTIAVTMNHSCICEYVTLLHSHLFSFVTINQTQRLFYVIRRLDAVVILH